MDAKMTGNDFDVSGNQLITHAKRALDASASYLQDVRKVVAASVMRDGRPTTELLERHQRAVHGLAWLATTVRAMAAAENWASRLQRLGRFGDPEQLVLRIGFGEYIGQITGGIPMSQNEVSRPFEFGLGERTMTLLQEAEYFLVAGNTAENRRALVDNLRAGADIDETLSDESLDMVRDQFRRFTAENFSSRSPMAS
jgi:(2S)-methylsuccinyl-CoA dehydrogenase